MSEFVLYFGICGMHEMVLLVIIKSSIFIAGYLFGYPLDQFVVLSLAEGAGESMNYGCSHLKMIAQDLFNGAGAF
jgi:hypothetical protein